MQREGIDALGALQKAREEHAAVLQHDHHEKDGAQRDHAPAHRAAVRQREPEPALRSAAALGQLVRAAHQRAVDEKEHNGWDEEEHVHRRGLFKVGIAHDLQIDICGQGAEAPADDDGRAEVREGADEREQQAHERRGPDERQNDIAQDGLTLRAEVARRAKAALVQLFEDAGEKHCVERHERDRLHQDDAPAIVGVQAQVQQAVGDPPAPPVELDVGERRDERRRDHGDEHDEHTERLFPPARRGADERRREREERGEHRRENADEDAVAQALAVLAQNGGEHRKAHTAVRAAKASQRDARDGPENEQQHAPEQDK